MSKTQNAVILKHRTDPTPSKVSGGTYWRFTWYRVSDGTEWETTVDSTMKNFNRWRALCESAQPPYGVYRGLNTTNRKTNRGCGIATADTVPERESDIDLNDAETTRKLIQQVRDSFSLATTTFDDLFVKE